MRLLPPPMLFPRWSSLLLLVWGAAPLGPRSHMDTSLRSPDPPPSHGPCHTSRGRAGRPRHLLAALRRTVQEVLGKGVQQRGGLTDGETARPRHRAEAGADLGGRSEAAAHTSRRTHPTTLKQDLLAGNKPKTALSQGGGCCGPPSPASVSRRGRSPSQAPLLISSTFISSTFKTHF